MSRRAVAIIGANYGDEAKGAWTDRLAGPDTLVVRANSGAQAGHTVVAPDGPRHVFSHVGSGAFRGATTFLSRFFVAAPELFLREVEELGRLGVKPRVCIDARAALTTPYDVIVNHAVELARGAGRHGSCGVGFGETLERAEKGFGLTVAQAREPARLAARLDAIRRDWVPRRLAALGVATLPEPVRRVLDSDATIPAFVARAHHFATRIEIVSDAMLAEARDILFENAQGLALDQSFGPFPHVTRSNTGLANIVALAREAGLESVEAIYATRCYLTRHGAGPLPHEAALTGFAIADPTNAPNMWQGALRFAPLDLDALAARVRRDRASVAGQGVAVTTGLALSCLDQAPQRLPLIAAGERMEIARDDLASLIADAIDAAQWRTARGPARHDAGAEASRRRPPQALRKGGGRMATSAPPLIA